ncbi:nuclear transport factor 2 family protein [Streptomyces longwoodensis]|uniref:nuclear transport factor 2 family protein n=1 Tax=Streptomyces longwoodensis TaxID=68231 RepID=UPI0034050F54
MNDTTEITQVILKERQGRDRGWFEQEESCFHPHSRVRITWFDGSGAEFVELSRASFAEGIRPSHQLSPPVVHTAADRAVAEVPAEISVVQNFGGVDAYVISHTRLLYRLERIDGTWKISSLDCVYDRDTLVPVVYGTSPKLDTEVLTRFRRPFMYLAYHLHDIGKSLRDDLYGSDRPEQVNELYQAAFDWLRQGPSTR